MRNLYDNNQKLVKIFELYNERNFIFKRNIYSILNKYYCCYNKYKILLNLNLNCAIFPFIYFNYYKYNLIIKFRIINIFIKL